MKYSLTALGPDQFEDMIRALCVKAIGPGVTVFGDGPDGGREASYVGNFDMTSGETWSGHTVIQAKFMVTPQGPAENLKWLQNEMAKELGRWGKADSKRRQKGRLPDNLIIVSNVSLSSAPGGGIDTANDDLKRFADEQNVPLRNWRVWPEQQVTALLDDARRIRIAYGGFLTPGDVLAQIAERLDLQDDDLTEALTAHVVKDMLQAKWVALDAVGRDDSDRVELGRVGVDLPASAITPNENRKVRAVDWIIRHADVVQGYRPGRRAPHVLLVGGPGQGKTTLTALLAQAYRIALLSDSSALTGEAQRLHADLSRQLADRQVPVPSNRRWPIRVDLAAFAEDIAGDTEPSLLRYLARRITSRSPHDITATQLNRWLGRYPWLLILDGLDEVASAAVREQVLRSVSDFLVDAGSRDADVVVVVTTRPQGYADELDPHDFTWLGLNELTTKQALAYADRLATERHPDDADLREHIHARLDEASSNQMTARLMTTPLQVTIMSRLLERRQRVPQERYALFEEYFEAIYSREVNKKGHIATLLEERRNDVAWVHERVALTCQVEAETAEGVSAAIERTRLRDIALERLSQEGLDDAEAQTIADRIADAALQRLVLLVPHGAGDSVGFEIRSLQEFMAARALTAAEGSDILQRLLPLVPSAHWRNTWLFAAGYLFRHREHLRSSLLGLLREVDVQDDLHQLAAPGSELAGELVMDGLAARSPQTNRALALHAMDRLHLPRRNARRPAAPSVTSGVPHITASW
ncbi:MAG: hypothetical protein JWQ37_1235 [Blastococcus sp.]|nr:hypothetical protein [Blastococcus sp.]